MGKTIIPTPDQSVQETFIVVGERTGQMHVRDLYGADTVEGVAINRVEQKLHLMNALGQLSGISTKQGLLTVGDSAIVDRYGANTSGVLMGAARNSTELVIKAKESFAQATGHYALIDQAIMPKKEVKKLTRKMFSNFLKLYYGSRNHEKSDDFRKQLEYEVRELAEDPEYDVSVFNRAHSLRPHKNKESNGDEESGELQELDAQERLESIFHDPRAGFLPTTTRERDRVLSWLDYLDNPENPLGIINQINEVFIRAQRQKPSGAVEPAVKYGVRAIESLTWEEGDLFLEAALKRDATIKLKAAIDEDQRPDLSLYEVFASEKADGDSDLYDILGDNALGLISYVQNVDLEEYLRTGQVEGLKDSPIMATEDPPRSRRPKFDPSPGKRKVVFDPYTRPELTKELKVHMIDRLNSITIGQARMDVDDLINRLSRQTRFHHLRLRDIEWLSRNTSFKPVGDALEFIEEQQSELGIVV